MAKNRKKQIQRQTTRKVNAADDRVDALVLRLRGFLERNLRTLLADLESGKYTAKEAAKALGGLEASLDEAGLREIFQRVRPLFADELEAVNEEFKDTTGKSAMLGKFTRQNLDAIIDDRIELASKSIETYVGDVRSIIMDAIIAGKTPKISEALEAAGGRVFHDVKTEVRTALIAYNRITHLEKAKKADITKFLYVGPADEVTRPFCDERVGKVFDIAEIESWDNGQGLPANIFCGGYNCRHHLRPLSDELAQELSDTGEDDNRDQE